MTQLKNKFFQIASATDSVTIRGVVTDKSSKENLPFVNIALMQGDSVIAATMTDMNGEYKLKADPKKYSKLDLKASYIGYENILIKDVAVTNDSVLNIDMKLVALMLGGIGSEIISPDPSGVMKISDHPVINELPNGTMIIYIGDDDL
ncbi:MAG: carboxypeptidase-like regulatory domain-containing protein [Bacteroidia bacterium]